MLQLGKVRNFLPSKVNASSALSRNKEVNPRLKTNVIAKPFKTSSYCTATQSPSHSIPPINKYKKEDFFDWGSIKERIFGDFGKPLPQPAIRRVAYVPEPTEDELITPTVLETEPSGDFLQFEPTRAAWHIPMVPKPRAVMRIGNKVTGMGRRKRAIANIVMTPGTGQIFVNGRHWMYYFKDAPVRNNILEPLTLTEYLNQWDITAEVAGGGFRGQAGAIRLAISRALLRWDPELQPPLKRAGYLTRDKREVERKKPGKLKARRSFQWVKR